MGSSIALLTIGWLFAFEGPGWGHDFGIAALLIGLAIRCGVFPFHLWIRDLFENASLDTAILYSVPLAGTYALVRLVIPAASYDAIVMLRTLAVFTAIYSAFLAAVQRDVRRFAAYLFASNSSLVLTGLALVTPEGTTGAICLWFSVMLSIGGFGLTLRSLEARYNRLELTRYLGLYRQSPVLATCFLLTGLASIGFPGTLGFIAADLLVDGAITANPATGAGVAIVAAINGIAMLRAYFLIFTGTHHHSTVPLRVRPRERVAVLFLTALILGGGLYPQPGVDAGYAAAKAILAGREKQLDPKRDPVVTGDQP
jgi:NADH-quinone oxidoreductase subunit M